MQFGAAHSEDDVIEVRKRESSLGRFFYHVGLHGLRWCKPLVYISTLSGSLHSAPFATSTTSFLTLSLKNRCWQFNTLVISPCVWKLPCFKMTEGKVVEAEEAQKTLEDFGPQKKPKRNKFAFACAMLASMTSILLGYGQLYTIYLIFITIHFRFNSCHFCNF